MRCAVAGCCGGRKGEKERERKKEQNVSDFVSRGVEGGRRERNQERKCHVGLNTGGGRVIVALVMPSL